MSKVSTQLLLIGLILVVITLGLNIYSSVTADTLRGEELFSTNWWARWFPLYGTGGGLMLVGAVLRCTGKGR
ncbi:hypothetical protein ACLPHM_14640 [Paenalcaligenes sp. Me131]|uniref:hypothetical protein n=1 Tax=Paenalcaligenes sp. Me131 TaxID=3392636 RepID=UPI003D2A156B